MREEEVLDKVLALIEEQGLTANEVAKKVRYDSQ